MESKKIITYALLERQYEIEKKEILEAQERVFNSGQYVLGALVEDLEEKISNFCGAKYCATLNSGTDALIFSMLAAGVKPGDEVITPPNSFIASAASIAHLGAKPVFVDIREDQNIDPSLIEKAITSKTKAIMPVHLTGRVAPMKEIMEIAKKHNLLVIEDAAQAFGSKYYNKHAGTFGDAGCFSAHPLKTFNAYGDGGFVVTNNEDIYTHIKRLRNHGLVDRNTALEWGFVSRLDAVQASILLVRLGKMEKYIEARRKNLSLFRSLLSPEYVFIPECKEGEYNTFQTFVIQVDHRDKLQKYLLDAGIQTSIHYPVPIHLQPAAKYLNYKEGDFPVTENQAKRILSVPASQFLTQEEIQYISDKINEFYSQKKYNAI